MSKKHTLQIVGWRGVKTAYLDISAEQALARYKASGGENDGFSLSDVETLEFDDQFGLYDAWGDE